MELITYQETLNKESVVYVDVRSPGEFEESTIPGAVNIPAYNNQERSQIGKVYTQQSPAAAKMLGVELIAPKLPKLVKQIKKLAKEYKYVVLFCARGGLRSESVGVVSELLGMKLYKLEGGYKNYRHYILNQLENYNFKSKLLVIHGYTGVGKTDILKELKKEGVPVIDLEGLANHRGSAFGDIGLGEPTNQKYFDSLLWEKLDELKNEELIAIEAESKRVGMSVLPDFLLEAMDVGEHILVRSSLERRVNRLHNEYVASYNSQPQEFINKILESLDSIKKYIIKRIGKNGYKELVNYAKEEQLKEVIRILLTEYYDPMYKYSQEQWGDFSLTIKSDELQEITVEIIEYINDFAL